LGLFGFACESEAAALPPPAPALGRQGLTQSEHADQLAQRANSLKSRPSSGSFGFFDSELDTPEAATQVHERRERVRTGRAAMIEPLLGRRFQKDSTL
jgi:hypothetical protein